jgi:hypothetical protein
MYKRQERANVKAYDEFDNNPMKTYFEHKTRLKVDCKIEDMTIVFLSRIMSFIMEHFLS